MPETQRAPVYVEREPRAELAPLVTKLWFLDVPTRGPIEWILPIPRVHAIVNLGEPYAVLRSGDTELGMTLEAGFVAGLQRTYLVNRNPERLRHVGAELRPYAFASLGMEPFAAEVRPASRALPALDGVRAALAPDAAPDECLAALEDALVAALAASGAIADPTVARVADEIDRRPDARVADVAAASGVSAGSLAQRFRRATGTTPKVYADTVRFHRFLTRLAEPGPLPTWTELIADTSYYDQPHFIRAFTRFAGLSPREYLRILGEEGRVEPSFLYPDGE